MPTIAKVCSAILNTRLNKYLTENELPTAKFFFANKMDLDRAVPVWIICMS